MMAENTKIEFSHESLVEQCYECPLTVDGELSHCPVAFIHLYHRCELSADAMGALFRDGERQTKKIIETQTQQLQPNIEEPKP